MGRPKKYITEEERKAARKAYNAKYYQGNKEKIVKQKAEYYQDNKEKIAEYKAAFYQDNKEKFAAKNSEWRKNNPEYWAEWYQRNKEKKAAYDAKYRLTPKGRAKMLIDSYRREDKKYNRGECTLTPEWIVEHIFSQPCHYCGETDWHELGCDRIDNSLPHTPENVVPCCWECNAKKARYSYEDYMMVIEKRK